MKHALFSEVYGTYYRTAAILIDLAIKGELDMSKMREVINDEAYGESAIIMVPALMDESWQLMDGSLNTPIINSPKRPYTQLELRFLKTISMDPRMALFETDKRLADLEELKCVEPLFMPEDIVYFDRYLDGDPYEDPHYIEVFRLLLRAIHEGRAVSIEYTGQKGVSEINCWPYGLEYSEKDDKFRTLVKKGSSDMTLNVARISNIRFWMDRENFPRMPQNAAKRENIRRCTLELTDERNALERALLHFAHFEKVTTRLDDSHYRIEIQYDFYDEAEIIIRILSFGPLIRVTEPDYLVNRIRDRLKAQLVFTSKVRKK